MTAVIRIISEMYYNLCHSKSFGKNYQLKRRAKKIKVPALLSFHSLSGLSA